MKIAILGSAAAAALLFANPAVATAVFNLDNVNLVDGGTLTGWISLSDDFASLEDFSITSSDSSGTEYGTFVGRTYSLSDTTSYTWQAAQGLWAQFADPLSQLHIFLANPPLMDGDNPLAVTTAEVQITTSGGTRWAESGQLVPDAVAAVPEAATWAMLVFGFGLVGTSLRRRERQPITSN